MKLHQIPAQLFNLKATDQYPPNVSQQAINRILARPRSETGGLDANISIKETARVMLTNNIDISDRLINGQLGTVVRIEVNQNNKKPIMTYIKFDDAKAGNSLIQKSTNSFVRQNRVVPIEPVLAKIKIHPNKPSSPEIQRMQFPLTLAYAVSIHKVQGLSLKDGAYYCYCAYVLRISRHSDFLSVMLTNIAIFLRGLKLYGKSRP